MAEAKPGAGAESEMSPSTHQALNQFNKVSGDAFEVAEPVGQLRINAMTSVKPKMRGIYPLFGERVHITYNAFREECMTLIEQNVKHSFVVGEDHTIDAFEIAVRKMKTGDTALLKAPPEYAFGTFGRPPLYPPYQKCAFSVTLETHAAFDYADPMKYKVRMNYVQSLWDRGNFLFYAMKEYSRAANVYANGVLYLHDHKQPNTITEKMMNEIHKMHKKLYAPLMHCYFQTENYRRSMQAAEKLLDVDPLNTKALFMRGRCLALTGNKNLGLQVLNQVHQLKPNDTEIKVALDALQNELLVDRDAKARAAKKNKRKSKGNEKKGKGSANSILAQKAFSDTIQTQYSTAGQASGSKVRSEDAHKEPLLMHILKQNVDEPTNGMATIEETTENGIEENLEMKVTDLEENMDKKVVADDVTQNTDTTTVETQKEEENAEFSTEIEAEAIHEDGITAPADQENKTIEDVELHVANTAIVNVPEVDIETQVNIPAIDVPKDEMDGTPFIGAAVEHTVQIEAIETEAGHALEIQENEADKEITSPNDLNIENVEAEAGHTLAIQEKEAEKEITSPKDLNIEKIETEAGHTLEIQEKEAEKEITSPKDLNIEKIEAIETEAGQALAIQEKEADKEITSPNDLNIEAIETEAGQALAIQEKEADKEITSPNDLNIEAIETEAGQALAIQENKADKEITSPNDLNIEAIETKAGHGLEIQENEAEKEITSPKDLNIEKIEDIETEAGQALAIQENEADKEITSPNDHNIQKVEIHDNRGAVEDVNEIQENEAQVEEVNKKEIASPVAHIVEIEDFKMEVSAQIEIKENDAESSTEAPIKVNEREVIAPIEELKGIEIQVTNTVEIQGIKIEAEPSIAGELEVNTPVAQIHVDEKIENSNAEVTNTAIVEVQNDEMNIKYLGGEHVEEEVARPAELVNEREIEIQDTDASIVENQKDNDEDKVSTSCCPGFRMITKRIRRFFGRLRRRR